MKRIRSYTTVFSALTLLFTNLAFGQNASSPVIGEKVFSDQQVRLVLSTASFYDSDVTNQYGYVLYRSFGGELIPFETSSEKVGFVDQKGVLRVLPKYDGVYNRDFSVDGLIPVQKGPRDEKGYLIDYCDGWGFLNMSGNEVIPCKFYIDELNYGGSDIGFLFDYFEEERRIICRKTGGSIKWGVIRSDGKVLIPFQHTSIKETTEGDYYCKSVGSDNSSPFSIRLRIVKNSQVEEVKKVFSKNAMSSPQKRLSLVFHQSVRVGRLEELEENSELINGGIVSFIKEQRDSLLYVTIVFNRDISKLPPMNGKLISVTLPEGLTVIDEDRFSGCDVLKQISLPETLESIGDMAFAYCEELEEIVIPSSVKTIGADAFWGCRKLKEVRIPSVTKFEVSSFPSTTTIIRY